jgi:hypothetical protein
MVKNVIARGRGFCRKTLYTEWLQQTCPAGISTA